MIRQKYSKIKKITIKQFRNFENIEFQPAERITIISGHNALGKSTLLGMIGHVFEIKVRQGKPILQNQFRTEFSEIIKLSYEYDFKPGKNNWEYIVTFYNNLLKITEERRGRLTYHKKDKRIRLVPRGKTPDGKPTSAKISWPVLYLGLSRLYPVGETGEDEITSKGIKLSKSEIEWFVKNYNKILSIYHEYRSYEVLDFENLKYKKTLAQKTDHYDFLSNSAGQDNLSQIMMAILSFERLQKKLGDNYHGGLLLIDELDATLHPSAQVRLLNFLYKESKRLGIQVIATTHSLTILEDLLTKYPTSNDSQNVPPVKIVYLKRKGNIKATIIDNPTYEEIKAILKNEVNIAPKKIKIFSEDAEARWFLKKLLAPYEDRIEIIDMTMGCNELIELRKKIEELFFDAIIILDSDAFQDKHVRDAAEKYSNILFLPGNGVSPERLFFDYLESLDPEDELFEKSQGSNKHFDYTIFKDYHWEQFKNGNCQTDRCALKRWFNYFKEVFEEIGLYERWEKDNEDEVRKFRAEFKKVFNRLARYIGITQIQD